MLLSKTNYFVKKKMQKSNYCLLPQMLSLLWKVFPTKTVNFQLRKLTIAVS